MPPQPPSANTSFVIAHSHFASYLSFPYVAFAASILAARLIPRVPSNLLLLLPSVLPLIAMAHLHKVCEAGRERAVGALPRGRWWLRLGGRCAVRC
ncbi:Uncharacterised protein [Mycobacteroides abscessus subsp. abscessus]|nr:Uncharacterised protein [Mycobacteroides abscessus subsp. abscessus]